jgi:hypothetical protein
MTAIALPRIPPRDIVCFRIGLWTLETSDEELQDKANWRSRLLRVARVCLHIGFAQFGFDAARCFDAAFDSIFFVFNGPNAIARNVRRARDRSAYADASISKLFYDVRI